MRRPIVCGGRDYENREHVFATLDELNQRYTFLHIIEGGCPTGADMLAREWAADRGIEYRHYPAKWKLQGKAAGPIRNQLMIDAENPDGVIAFPGKNGTADMKSKARAANIPVLEITARRS